MVAAGTELGWCGSKMIRSHSNGLRAMLVPAVVLAMLATDASGDKLKIASLHPIISDLARQVGGDRVDVTDLMPKDSNPHTYYPTPANLKIASGADLVLASGKGLEAYLEEFRESLGGNVPVYEVGRAVPSLKVEVDEVFVCCPTHASGAIDPHWWHSIRNMRRAVMAMADEFARLRPEERDVFRSNADAYAIKLDALYHWAKTEISSIPRADRELTTAHAAFGYLCREMGLRSITVLGLTTAQDAEPGYLKDVIRTLREYHVRAVFPEVNANPKVLESIARDAGVAIGGHLYADLVGLAESNYESMVRHNILTIVHSLKGSE